MEITYDQVNNIQELSVEETKQVNGGVPWGTVARVALGFGVAGVVVAVIGFAIGYYLYKD